MQNAAVDLGNVCWLLDAFLEFNILVPEWVTLKIESNEVSTSFKKPVESAYGIPHKREGMGDKGRDHLAE